jgi:hypothetical protein
MLTKSFTDSYGITHTNALVAIESCNTNSNENYDESGAKIGENSNVNYSYRYWTSQTAKDSGAEALNGHSSIDTAQSLQGTKTLFEWCEEDLDTKLV